MEEQFLGEIRMMASDYAPAGWALCDGAALPIAANERLFSLIGTTYGGSDNRFHLPDLRGRAPVHIGRIQDLQFLLGDLGGVEQVTLSVNQLPAHHHDLIASDAPATRNTPLSLAESGSMQLYNAQPPDVSLTPTLLATAGGSQPHDNMQPFLVINYIISLEGEFPLH